MDLFRRISDSLGIRWAPANVPMKRRLQTLAATAWICLILFGEGLSIYLFIKLLYSSYWWLGLLYGTWILYDVDTCNKGSRTIEWVRNWAWWRYYCEYFPIRLFKTVDLDPEKNYLFACFPHGVVCSGVSGAFASNALDFRSVFPGMTSHLITLGGHFLVPFFRELIISLGFCASTQESLLYLLDRRRFKGKCVALVVGGAAEALDAHPGEYKVILSKRKGFIKVAMKAGSPLVPVFAFGEPDLFRPMKNPDDSYLRVFQEFVRKWTGISPIFPVGRGMFQYSYGVVPLREPNSIVVGEPMEIKQNYEPTNEEVDAVHKEFVKRLRELFESGKSKYLRNPEKAVLTIT